MRYVTREKVFSSHRYTVRPTGHSISMFTSIKEIFKKELDAIETAGLHKAEHILDSRQGRIVHADGREILNFCANNYLGLSGSDALIEAAKQGLDRYGFGLSSVRFICGTQTIHKELEQETARFLKKDDAVLYSSCMSANMGFFASFLTDQDAILTDALNHASLIDGIRLTKAERYIFKHMDVEDLERGLQQMKEKRIRCVVTDGVFSMDGDIAPLKEIAALTKKYDALFVVDDSHATGFVGKNGRGTPEHCGVEEEADVITSTYGKALGGASGGFIAGRKELIDLLRERSRTYLFSNSLPPVVAAVSLFALHYTQEHPELREALWKNVEYFRQEMAKAGFELPVSVHPIVPVMIGDAIKTKKMAAELFAQGIYAVGFSYPVVPEGKARIRVQISAAHTKEDLDKAVIAFRHAAQS